MHETALAWRFGEYGGASEDNEDVLDARIDAGAYRDRRAGRVCRSTNRTGTGDELAGSAWIGIEGQSVNISCIKEKYLVSFLEGKIIELKIINEKGEPIKDAIVNFSVKKFLEDRDLIYSYRDNKEDYKTGSFVNSIHNPMEQKVTTNQLGIAILTGLYEKSILSIKVQHENYADFKEEWELGEDEQGSRNIVLKQPFKIFGKIIFEGKPVAGAIVLLSKEWQETIKTQSDTNGNFSFNNVPGNFDIEEYDVTAFHLEYGIQNNFSLQKDLIDKGINIELIKEQYCRIKLIDEKDQPVSNIKIILKEEHGNRFSGLKDSLIFSLKTDLNGIAEFYNLPYWNFEFFIDDEIYTIIKSDRESIDEMLYTLKKKDLRKILINLPNEPLLKSEIKVYIFDRYQNRSILNIRYIKNMYYIELENCESYLDHFTNDYSIGFIFELPGYPSVTFDNFHSKEDIPNEFQVNFQTGFNLKVKVIAPFQNAPIEGISINIFNKDNNLLFSLPSNELGEAVFSSLNGEYKLEINDPEFSRYNCNIFISKNDEMLIRLIKGGNLIAHLNLPDKFMKAELYFHYEVLVSRLTYKGNFEINNIRPGLYTLFARIYDDVDSYETLEIPTKINIENDKTLEINLDELLNSKNILRVIVKNEENEVVPNAKLNLYVGAHYQLEDFFHNQEFWVDELGNISIPLIPSTHYYLTVEADSNYQMTMIPPFEYKPDKINEIVCVLPKSRILKNIQVLDFNGNPLEGVDFIYKDNKGNYFERHFDSDLRINPSTNEDGFFSELGWPKGNFSLIVSKEEFEFKEVNILENFTSDKLIQIKLNKGSSLQCDFPSILQEPISIGLLDSKGEFLNLPIISEYDYINNLPSYFSNIRMGSLRFKNLAAGTYYIGYFQNGTKNLIAKQGPFTIGVEENLVVKSNFEFKEK